MDYFKTSIEVNDLPTEIFVLRYETKILFPKMVLAVPIKSEKLIAGVESGSIEYIGIITKLENTTIGTISKIQESTKSKAGINILLEGLYRFKIKEKVEEDIYKVKYLENTGAEDIKAIALLTKAKELFSKLNRTVPTIPRDIVSMVNLINDDIGLTTDMMAFSSDTSIEEKQSILEIIHLPDRLELLVKILNDKLDIIELGHKIELETRKDINGSNKEYYIHKKIKAHKKEITNLKKELGEEGSFDDSSTDEYKKRIEEANLPEEAKDEALRELRRMERMHSASHEHSKSADYLDWVLDLPWNIFTEDETDLQKSREVLDGDHFGLKKPKERIVEYLAVKKLKKDSQSPILCFVGSPGVGKTSLGKSIANALGRKFHRVSLGGVRDESEIRGHRRTYVGALPGRIIQGLRKAGTSNPVFMLDEIDKLGQDNRGDPSSALLEALDPEQNYSFSDHYLNVAYDLSKVMFITTANVLETIPPALRDRMEVIELAGYSQDEKISIANDFLIPRQLEKHGIEKEQLSFLDESLDEIINGYTAEAGVRNLEREIANICRGVATKIVDGKTDSREINKSTVSKYLDDPKFETKKDIEITRPGLVVGMSASAIGGDVNIIETISMQRIGKVQKITTSGQLGDSLKESIEISMSWIRSNQSYLKDKIFKNDGRGLGMYSDIHIHFPAGGIKKDGPSGGIATTIALISLLTKKKIKGGLAMTGEMTLRGKVLPVGGVKDKVLAAHRADINTIILPKWNEKDIKDIPKDTKKDIEFHFVNNIEEVIDLSFEGES